MKKMKGEKNKLNSTLFWDQRRFLQVDFATLDVLGIHFVRVFFLFASQEIINKFVFGSVTSL